MNALRLMNVLALLLTLLPWRAQAAEADDFVAASRSQQAQLLTQWAAAPQADRLPLLRALTTESLVMDDGKHAFRTRQGGLQPLGAVAAPQGETRPVRLTNRLRNLAAGALASHLILSDNVTERASAARTLQREATPAMAAGWRVCRSSARMPPTNIDASPWTRPIGEAGSNHRGPGRPWIRCACLSPSGPATRMSRSQRRTSSIV